MNDNRDFPIQGELTSSKWGRKDSCTIPWWLAEKAYWYYARLYGNDQSLERLSERGGFGRNELLSLLRYDVKLPELKSLLMEVAEAISEAVTNEDGLDGGQATIILEKIHRFLRHRRLRR